MYLLAALHKCDFDLVEHLPYSSDLFPSGLEDSPLPELKRLQLQLVDVVSAVEDFFFWTFAILQQGWQKCVKLEENYCTLKKK